MTTLETALMLAEKGYRPLPLLPGTKKPAFPWKKWQTAYPIFADIERWYANTHHNIAIVTTGLVVADADQPDLLELVLRFCGKTPMIVGTPRSGFHCYYRARAGVELGNLVGIKGMALDIRTSGGYAVCPPSTLTGKEKPYEWLGEVVPAGQLPVFKVAALRERTRRKAAAIARASTRAEEFSWTRARAYMAKIEPAVSGQGGHKKTFYAAIKAVWLARGDAEIAWILLNEYNRRCQPPWDEHSLMHKLTDALEKFRNP